MARRCASILLLILAGAVALPGVGGLRGLVLCVTSEGHIAVEATHGSPSCATECDGPSSAPGAPEAPHDIPTGTSDRHACLDIPLGATLSAHERGRRSTDQLEGGDVPPAPVLAGEMTTPFPSGRSSWEAARTGRPPPHLASVRTINLRV